MRAFLLMLAAAILTGCSARANIQVSSGSVITSSSGTTSMMTSPSGATISSSSAGLNVQAGGSNAVALIGLGMAALAIHAADSRAADYYGVRYRANPFMAITDQPAARAPELAPDRRVSEQDCSKVIEDSLANLKCR